MNKSRTLQVGLVALMGTLGLVGGCQSMPGGTKVGLVPITGLETPIPEGMAPALDVQNHRGTVMVVIDPKAPGPWVKATPRLGGRLDQPARWTAASMMMDNGRPVLRVLSAPEDTGAPDVPVELTIVMPSVGGVRVQNDDGPVTLRDVRGAIEVQTSLSARDGHAIFVQTSEDLTEPVLLRAETGDIEVRMGRGSKGRIVADARNGKVTVDGHRGNVRDVKVERGTYTGTMNGGSSEQRITADQGNVLVLVGIP